MWWSDRENEEQIMLIHPTKNRAISIFDQSYYLGLYSEVEGSRLSPEQHFVRAGFDEGRDPCALFDSDWYRHKYGLSRDENCLAHYLRKGFKRGFEPSPYFNTAFYRSQAKDIPESISPLEHFRTVGWKRLLDVNPLFDTAWYLDQFNEPLSLGVIPIEHYISEGWRTGNSPSPMFISDSYYELNQDVKYSDINALHHYLAWGRQEGRTVSELIDSDWYAAQYPDDSMVQSWGAPAHFARFGSCEGRTVSPDLLAQRITQYACNRARRLRNHLRLDGYGDTSSDPFDLEARLDSLNFVSSTNSRVSVIIPTFNHSKDVVACLETIAIAADQTPYEVIVVDDCSSADESALLSRIPGIRYIRHEKNQGFSGACTTGVNASHSEFFLLLNNDTEVFPGWIDSLVAEMDDHPKTGVTGSMILRANLRLQEAGGIIWSDATGAHYGSHDNPCGYQYRFRRSVDFCSGAALLIRRELWTAMGGFDQKLAPAYYEDVDVCFNARRHGYECVYQPNSLIVHREGSTHGSSSFGLKRKQFENRHLLVDKWQVELRTQVEAPHGDRAAATLQARDRRRERHILICDHQQLDTKSDAGSVRMNYILKEFARRDFVVHFLSVSTYKSHSWVDDITRAGVEILNPGDEVEQFLLKHRDVLECIIVSRPEVMAHLATRIALNAPQVPLIYDMVDAHGMRLRRKAELLSEFSVKDAEHIESVESKAARMADITIAVSQSDEQYIQKLCGESLKTAIIPTIHPVVDGLEKYENREGILFVGGFQHDPNVDAVKFLVKEILPQVQQKLGSIQFTIIGSNAKEDVFELQGESVNVLGWVEDLLPHYNSHKMVVAPLRYGAGVKGKIGEALSHGIPTVTTSVGVEGMPLVNGQDILFADTADEIADAVVKVYNDEKLWTSLSLNGQRKIDSLVGSEALRKMVDDLLDQVSGLKA
jgi:GT2 family glycosyltransferase/glycosyltransferase involved in cell wall biosynthesis